MPPGGQLANREREDRLARLERQLDLIKDTFDINPRVPREREALAQHYGLSTRCLDLVDHVQTAAWFAYYRQELEDTESRDAVGHIYLVAADDSDDWADVVDLRTKPSNWLRPHIQQALAVFPGVRALHQNDFNYLTVARFIVPRPLLRQWSAYEAISPDVMFPPATQDQGARYWDNATEVLRAAGCPP